MAEPKYLLDRDMLICLLEGASSLARTRVESCEPGAVVTSTIAFAELMLKVPVDDPKKRADVEKLFTAVGLLPFDSRAALAYARVPFRRGRLDRLIAAHALAVGLVVVTNNEADFADVPNLATENWTLP